MQKYASITIIYNPNSTGPGKQRAQALTKELKYRLPKQTITLIATKRAGHAEELTYKIAKKSGRPLIISVSGDGGYNEVVNGAAKAYANGFKPVVGLLPAGNANDHYESTHGEDFLQTIVSGNHHAVDILKLTAESFERYAHSYIGLALTPRIGAQLTAVELNRIKESWIVMKALLKPRYTRLVIDGELRKIDSLIASNIPRMAKVLTLSKDTSLTDGLFEVNIHEHHARLRLLWYLFKATTRGLTHTSQTDHYYFRTVRPTAVQLDGEVFTLPGDSDVDITIVKLRLDCIV